MEHWKKLSKEAIKSRVFAALENNINFYEENILGVPASHLDSKVFYQDAPFLQDAPYLSTLIRNPNHIGCHTRGRSEHFFAGTQQLERELIELCAEQILKAQPNSCDGYVASGGTEANLQAIWIYRNYFQQEWQASLEEICILCSQDSHYSMKKAANLLCLDIATVAIDEDTRSLSQQAVAAVVQEQKARGKKYFIVVANMMTTMFGSVDDVSNYTEVLEQEACNYKLHIDGAYGGFYYPFTEAEHQLDFSNPKVSSVTLDAHKMVQAPYGTGIFLVRKGFMQYANTKEASYVEGEDCTLIGSRSGANAVAIWMILMHYGYWGWKEKTGVLQERARWFARALEQEGITFYRHPYSNIVTINSGHLNSDVAIRFGLVPDKHAAPAWYKVVVMEHVSIEQLELLLEELKQFKTVNA